MAEKEPQFPLKAVTCGLIALVAVSSLFFYINLDGSLTANDAQAAYRNLYGSTPFVDGNYSFSPPISMYKAAYIALASDGWEQSSLQNMTVHASLAKMIFYTNTSALLQYEDIENLTLNFHPGPATLSMPGSGIITIGEVEAPVRNYQPQFLDHVTVRYTWRVTITQNVGISIPPPGLYYVDASSGELVPTGHPF